MSKITEANKIAEQARRIDNAEVMVKNLKQALVTEAVKAQAFISEYAQSQQSNRYLLEDLYKIKPDHEMFAKDPALAESVKKMIEEQQPKKPEKPDLKLIKNNP